MITVERTTENGYVEENLEMEDAIKVLNTELENKKVLWINRVPYEGEFVTEDVLSGKDVKVEVTNMLVGG